MDNDLDSIIGILNDSNVKPLIKPPRPINRSENVKIRPRSLAKPHVHPIPEGIN